MADDKTKKKSRIKTYALRIGALLLALLLIMSVKAMSMSSHQPAVTPLADKPVDGAAIAKILAGALEKKTVSESQANPAPADELAAMHAHLAASFPKTHEKLTKENVGSSLLFTWKADQSKDLPIILCAHQDVVPIEPGTEDKWAKPPFAGQIDDRFVWGRGALDDKGSLVSILAAIESLVEEGFTPKRTLYLAFGQDEEIAGKEGAAKIIDLLASRGVKAEAVLDEGNPMVRGIVPNIAGDVAPIGIAEKGYLTLTLSVDLPGGHSSTPAREQALGAINEAVAKLRANPFPARLDGATEQFFSWAAPEMGFGPRLILANTWLTWPLVKRMFAKSPALDASLRTTTAVTIFKSGVKDNVIPRTAEATVNFRILPGDTTDSVIAHVRDTIDDARIKIEPQAATRQEPTKVSRIDNRMFPAIATAVREVFPGTVVAPALFLGATDGRQYLRISDDVYRFLPVPFVSEDLSRIHGTDERIEIEALKNAVRFYRRLVRLVIGPAQ
jgi:carboxypeptidase PM20D1